MIGFWLGSRAAVGESAVGLFERFGSVGIGDFEDLVWNHFGLSSDDPSPHLCELTVFFLFFLFF